MESLRKNLDELRREMDALDNEVANAITGKDTTVDIFRIRDRRSDLALAIQCAEAKLLQHELEALQKERQESKAQLQKLRPVLKAAADEWRRQMDAQSKCWE